MVNCLEIQSVIKRYNDKLVLSDIYIKLETDKIIGIFGKNGSGKSTLFNIIYGVELSENCQIRYNDKIILRPFSHTNLISYSTQDSFFPKNISVRKALELFLDRIPDRIEDRFNNVLQQRIGNLSGGEQKLLQLYTVLSCKSKFIILDEPFNHLSPIACEQIKVLISKCASEKCIIISDHSFNNVLDLTQENYYLQNGSLRKLNNKSELYESSYVDSNFW